MASNCIERRDLFAEWQRAKLLSQFRLVSVSVARVCGRVATSTTTSPWFSILT